MSATRSRDYESSLKAFREMLPDEWNGLIQSIARGGVLEAEEKRAFDVVIKERQSTSEPVSAALAIPEVLLDVMTGEVMPATTESAHQALVAIREREQQLRGVKADVTAFMLEQSRVQGTKTFHASAGDVVLSGGSAIEYDADALADCLREAGCPEERINEAVVATISYAVNRSVLRQLISANPDYRAAAELAERTVEKPWRATAK